jgi:hypothetical protein
MFWILYLVPNTSFMPEKNIQNKPPYLFMKYSSLKSKFVLSGR